MAERHVLMMSGGICSWYTGHLLARELGEPPEMLFADTLVEDNDLYRFLLEGAGLASGRPRPSWASLLEEARALPPLKEMPQRKAALRSLRWRAGTVLPHLHWVVDGRTPWEVFKDKQYLGNTRLANCSHALKQDTCRRWLEGNCQPGATVLHVGIHWSEMERFTGTSAKPGIRQLWSPWACRALLCELPYRPADEMFKELERCGVRKPYLYEMGFTHNNCFGACVKAGHANFARLLAEFPETFEFAAGQEEEVRRHLGKDVAILRDRRGGRTRPLTLIEFRQRVEGGEAIDSCDVGGCGCFASPPPCAETDEGEET